MLEIVDLHVNVGDVEILRKINLSIKPGTVHAIMGPNGSGKSTLANVLAGHPLYRVTSGSVLFNNADLLQMRVEERARAGLFLSFQHPLEIPGVRLDHFMRASFNAIRKENGLEELGVLKFNRLLKAEIGVTGMDASIAKRSINEGFSGGERKRVEILQMTLLEPKLAILDEPDSGLDVDAIRMVAASINQLHRSDSSTMLVTHYQRILDYVIPDVVHVLINGEIIKSGGKELAVEIETDGYDKLERSNGT